MNTQLNQIVKGLHKYEEPFTPSHWTADELLNHALEETVDTVHYLVGLKELIDQKESQIHFLKEKVKLLESDLSHYIKMDPAPISTYFDE